jgi:hypothetical protein
MENRHDQTGGQGEHCSNAIHTVILQNRRAASCARSRRISGSRATAFRDKPAET